MTVRVSDIIVPEVFNGYARNITEQKSRIIQSGLMVRNPEIDTFLAGGGMTFHIPSFRDLDDTADRVATDTSLPFASPDASLAAGEARPPNPLKVGTFQEVGVRMNRNQSWASTTLAAVLSGADPMAAIADRVGAYWARRLQDTAVAVMRGVIADNTANDTGDYTHDISGTTFADGVTNFSAEAFIDTTTLMGDSMGDLTAIMVHSVVYARMQKNNLIDFIPDSNGVVNIPTFLGRQVIVDDGMPRTGSVYDTWLFGAGVLQLGESSPKAPETEVQWLPGAGNGAGMEVLWSRRQLCVHPTGHAYQGPTSAVGGPANADLDDATSWNRVYPERKQIKFARLVTREA